MSASGQLGILLPPSLSPLRTGTHLDVPALPRHRQQPTRGAGGHGHHRARLPVHEAVLRSMCVCVFVRKRECDASPPAGSPSPVESTRPHARTHRHRWMLTRRCSSSSCSTMLPIPPPPFSCGACALSGVAGDGWMSARVETMAPVDGWECASIQVDGMGCDGMVMVASRWIRCGRLAACHCRDWMDGCGCGPVSHKRLRIDASTRRNSEIRGCLVCWAWDFGSCMAGSRSMRSQAVADHHRPPFIPLVLLLSLPWCVWVVCVGLLVLLAPATQPCPHHH